VSSPLQSHAARRVSPAGEEQVEEQLAEETAVALLLNGEPQVVMMCSPLELEDFALGFALSEAIVERADELRVVDQVEREHGIALHLAIPQARFDALSRRRTLAGRTGCGLCGAETLEQAIRPVRRVAPAAIPSPAQLLDGFARLAAAQPLNHASGALHAAAALCGERLVVREDVGRHNALDKVIGALAREGTRADALLVTSRASYELVHKTAQAGVATLAAVSAPTAFAVRLAREAGVALFGFARGERITRYDGADTPPPTITPLL
jgi:formate dehydrogenase accessory protein FdhD